MSFIFFCLLAAVIFFGVFLVDELARVCPDAGEIACGDRGLSWGVWLSVFAFWGVLVALFIYLGAR